MARALICALALAACGGNGSEPAPARQPSNAEVDFTQLAGEWGLAISGRCPDGSMHVDPVIMTKDAGADVALVKSGTWVCGADGGTLSGTLDGSGVHLNLAREPAASDMQGYAMADAVFTGDAISGSIYPVSVQGYGGRMAFTAHRR